jgi:hypothetical protein
MKNRHYLVCGVLLVAAAGVLLWWAFGQPRHETSVRDLNPPDQVVGCLGKPLGSRLVIEGVSVGEMGEEERRGVHPSFGSLEVGARALRLVLCSRVLVLWTAPLSSDLRPPAWAAVSRDRRLRTWACLSILPPDASDGHGQSAS